MAQIRFYKATNGKVTVFRSTTRHRYSFANFGVTAPIGFVHNISFSAKRARYPAVEIDKGEYDALVKARHARTSPGISNSLRGNWVRNAEAGLSSEVA